MTKLIRYQRRRTRGHRLPAGVVCVTRPTPWGNPFRTGDAAADVAAYRRWLKDTPEGRDVAEAARRELRGKSLACWCRVGGPCHADVLIEVANNEGR